MGGAVPFNDNDDFTPEDLQTTVSKRRQEMTRTPEHYISADEKTASRTDHERIRHHASHNPHSASTRVRTGAISRGTIDSPPPAHSTHIVPSSTRRSYREGRPDIARSFRGDDSGDDEANPDNYYPPPPTNHSSRIHSSKKCKQCERQKETFSRQIADLQEDLKATRAERERLEQINERLRKDLQMAQNPDVAYGQLYHDNEKLRQENKRLRKETSEVDPDRAYHDRQYEELKKAKEDLAEEVAREKSAHKAYKKDCNALKAEYNNIRLKNEELVRANWQLKDENYNLNVRMMEEASISRRPGDGGSEDSPSRSNYASEIAFNRHAHLRQTYHFSNGDKNEVTRDSRSHRGRLEMKRTSSEGKRLDYDEPVKENAKQDRHHKAKTNKSAGTSDIGSVGDNLVFSLVSTIPDEQAQVFMVLNEDVSKSVLPEGLPKDQELAMIYALQNCHSIQELIKCLVSNGASSSTDRLDGFQRENEHLKCRLEHFKSRLTTMTNSFEKAKEDMIARYHEAREYEANNTRLRHALKLCQQACEVKDILMEYRNVDSRTHGSGNSYYFPSFDNILDTTTRSPDREALVIRNTLPGRARALLNQLESNPELQSYLPYGKHGRGTGEYHGHWPPGTLSQNTGTTSGLSSMSGGTEIDVTPSDLERLKQYSQALIHYENQLLSTMVSVDGLSGIATVKKQERIVDSVISETRGDTNDMEDAAHAEELCKVREEKAELKSQIYMMNQEKRRMELEVGRLKLQQQKTDKLISELRYNIQEEKRKRKKERKRKNETAISSHDPNHMSELSIEYSSALEREKEQKRRYEDLFKFLQSNIKASQETTDDLMRFVKELRRANSALVDAFEKSKKRQQAEKRRMKHELVTYMNRFQANGGAAEM